jgi:hypothetical protein
VVDETEFEIMDADHESRLERDTCDDCTHFDGDLCLRKGISRDHWSEACSDIVLILNA